MKNKIFILRYPVFCIFAFIALAIILLALSAPLICGDTDPFKGSLAESIKPPSAEHIFGTDKMGRDIFTRVMYGARTSLSSTFTLVAAVFVIGTVLGVISGYCGGITDTVIMRSADMMMSFPGLVLAIAVAGILGASMENAMIAVATVTWPKYTRLARSLVMKIRHADFVEAAVVTGSRPLYIFARYMLPNVLPTMVITAATDIGGMMMELSALSFLGFGAVPPSPEWGRMLSEGKDFMQSAPWLMIFPGLAIFLTVVIFNMLGDSLRDILDPHDKQR